MMNRRFFIIALSLLVALTVLPATAAPTAQFTPSGSLAALTEPEDNILPLIFCRGTEDLTAGEVTWGEGHKGQAAVLDGTDSYFRMDGTLLQEDELSFSLWVNWLDADTLPAGQRLLSMRGADRNTRYMALSPNGGETGEGLCLEMQVGSNTVVLAAKQNTPLSAGWHHIAFVWDTTTLHLYLDGKEVAQEVAPAVCSVFAPRQLCVGKGMRTGENGYMHAAVDELYLHNRALTAEEVEELAGVMIETTTSTETPQTTTTAATVPARPQQPVTDDPLQADNRLWMILIPLAAVIVLAATVRPLKQRK